jgi:hypothetical protein
MAIRRIPRLATRGIVAGAALALAACGDATAPVATDLLPTPRPNMVVINDPVVLAARMTDAGGAPVAIVPEAGTDAALQLQLEAMPFRLRAAVAAPVVDGQSLAATHVVFSDDHAYVAYATASDTTVGAIDVFDIDDPSRPRLVSSARFTDAKILTLAVDRDKRLFVGTASGDPAFAETPAVVEEIHLDGGRLTTRTRRVAVGSWVVTGLHLHGDHLWVTSGHSADRPGVLTVLDEDDLRVVSAEVVGDARAVSRNGNVMTVLIGGPGRVRLYDASSRRFISEFAVGGLSRPGHKATIANVANWGFVSTGEAGVALTRIRQNGSTTGVRLFNWGRPELAGLPAEWSNTNAVAASGDYVYAANGGAGVWVATGNWSRTAQNLVPTVTPLGRLALDDVSSNMVGVENGSLFVAAGRGGLRILEQPR